MNIHAQTIVPENKNNAPPLSRTKSLFFNTVSVDS